MLLELLSDFQISIPELGVIEARTHPIVVLTSNNSRELTEALKRRCLYLWLDYPDAEREHEIVQAARARPAGVGRAPARRGRPHGAQPRPEEAAVDRRVDRLGARAAPARRRGHRPVGARAHDVDHRQAPHRPRHGRRARRGEADRWAHRTPVRASGFAPRLLEFADELRREGMHVGTSELLDAFAALEHVAVDDRGGLPLRARRDAREVAGGPARLRHPLRPLLLPRGRARGGRARADRAGLRATTRATRATRTCSTWTACATRSATRSARAPTATCATWHGSRSRRSGARARAAA